MTRWLKDPSLPQALQPLAQEFPNATGAAVEGRKKSGGRERGSLDTETNLRTGRTPHGGEGRDEGDAPASQGVQKNAGKPLEERHGTDSLSEGTNPTNTLILDFSPPEL